MSAEVNSILIVRLGAMGDIIHTLPAAASLKHSFPRARVTWVVQRNWIPLLESNEFVDRIVPFDRREPRTWIRTRQQLREEHYDLAVDFQGLIKSALIAHLAGPEKLFGFGKDAVREKAAGWFYSARANVTAVHVVDRALQLTCFAGASNLPRVFPLPAGTPEGSLPEERFVLGSPLAGWASKQWPLEYWAKLAQLLRSELRVPLVLNGAPGSLPDLADALRHESGLAGLVHGTRRASFVVGVDSGPMHLAAALGKPGIAIFGPTDPERNGPYPHSGAAPFEVLRQPNVPTTYKRGSTIDPSMRAITPEQVFEMIRHRWPATLASQPLHLTAIGRTGA